MYVRSNVRMYYYGPTYGRQAGGLAGERIHLVWSYLNAAAAVVVVVAAAAAAAAAAVAAACICGFSSRCSKSEPQQPQASHDDVLRITQYTTG